MERRRSDDTVTKRRAWLRSLTSSVTGVERWTLVTIAFAAAALVAFVNLAAEVGEGNTRAFEDILLALRNPADPTDPIGPRWFEEIICDFTAFGGTGVLFTISLTITGFRLLIRKRRAATTLAISLITGTLLSHALKWGFDRPRPDLVPHGTSVYTQSFPRGHAMLSAIVYLTLGGLLARVQARRRAKVYLLLMAVLLTVVVGASRVYLGVHWPTDVLAGWAVGAAWALLCWLILLWLQRNNARAGRRPPPEEP
jgi:undecaprenyl-diphosphatase